MRHGARLPVAVAGGRAPGGPAIGRLARRWALVALLLAPLAACSRSAATPTAAPATAAAPVSPTAAFVTPASSARAPTRPAAAPTPPGTPGTAASCAPGVDFLGFSDALDKARYGDTDVGGLSGLAYDPGRGVYYALVDNQGNTPARFYTLRLPLDGGRLGTPAIEAVTVLRDAAGQPFTGRNFDGEGIAFVGNDQLLIVSETEPAIRRFALDGRLLGEVAIPPRFLVKPQGEATENQTFEGLALSPDGLTMFAALEGPLAPDGFTGDLRGRLRFLRFTSRPPFLASAQYFYLAEPAQGVADLAMPSADALLVLERGFIPGLGNTIRAFRVGLAGAIDVTDRPALTAPGPSPLPKDLLFDLARCPASGARHPATQANPLLDNVETLALGPTLPDGRRVLLLLSDDNFGRDQVTRVIALAWRP